MSQPSSVHCVKINGHFVAACLRYSDATRIVEVLATIKDRLPFQEWERKCPPYYPLVDVETHTFQILHPTIEYVPPINPRDVPWGKGNFIPFERYHVKITSNLAEALIELGHAVQRNLKISL